MNLNELLEKLEMAENAMADEFSDEEMLEAMRDINQKVDSIYSVITQMDAEQARLASLEKDFYDQKKRVAKNKERLEKWVLFAMKNNNMPMLKGTKFQVKLVEKQKFIEEECEITPLLAMKLNTNYPGLIKIKYSLSKSKLKEAYNSNEELKKYARYESDNVIKFSLRKDI